MNHLCAGATPQGVTQLWSGSMDPIHGNDFLGGRFYWQKEAHTRSLNLESHTHTHTHTNTHSIPPVYMFNGVTHSIVSSCQSILNPNVEEAAYFSFSDFILCYQNLLTRSTWVRWSPCRVCILFTIHMWSCLVKPQGVDLLQVSNRKSYKLLTLSGDSRSVHQRGQSMGPHLCLTVSITKCSFVKLNRLDEFTSHFFKAELRITQ